MKREIFVAGLKNPPMFLEEERKRIIKKSIARCHWKTKLTIVMEELAELSQHVSKHIRGCGDKVGLMEEMADVYICLEFLKSICHISDEDLQKAIDVKLRREKERF